MSFQPSVAIVNVHNQKRIAVAVETPATTKRNVTVPSKFFTLRLNPWLVVSSSLYKGFLRFLTADDVISKWGWFKTGCDPDFGSRWSYQVTGRASLPVARMR